MTTLSIAEGRFILVPAANCTQQWLADDGAQRPIVYDRSEGFAVVAPHGTIIDVYCTREHAERRIDPAAQAALSVAKARSGAYWA